jgi:hypothetical protein
MVGRLLLLGFCATAVACGDSGSVPGDDGGATDGSPASDATGTGDADSGGQVSEASSDGPGGGGDGSTDAPGGGDDGSHDASGVADGPSDAVTSDAADATSESSIIGIGDDGPGNVFGDATVTFACGPSIQCNAQTQFCLHDVGPVAPDGSTPETFACTDIPSQCEPNPTCTCLSMTSAGGGCPCMIAVGLEVDCLRP